MDWDYVEREHLDLRGAMLVTGLPSPGMVGPIAAGFLVEENRMRVVGSLLSEEMNPVAVAHQGVVTSPLQLWASELACGIDGRCDRLLVLKCDVPIPPAWMMPLAGMISRFALDRRVGLVVALEGISGDVSKFPSGPLVAASTEGNWVSKKLSATPLDRTTIAGFSAALLLAANRVRIPAVSLYQPVRSDIGDAAAAAELLRRIDPLVPNLELAPTELSKRVESVQAAILRAQDEQARAGRRLREQIERGYA